MSTAITAWMRLGSQAQMQGSGDGLEEVDQDLGVGLQNLRLQPPAAGADHRHGAA
jgi:hypothetical protein